MIETFEKRFLEVAELNGDLSVFPLSTDNHLQVKTNKAMSKEHGEVFTPLWLVDKMIQKKDDWESLGTTLDLCAGYGQFTIRLFRFLVNNGVDLETAMNKHWVSELQRKSCYKLLYIFGERLNMAIGDARNLSTLPDNAKGIWAFDEKVNKWKNVTKTTLKFYNEHKDKAFADYWQIIEKKFPANEEK